jgi:hypothetical protein
METATREPPKLPRPAGWPRAWVLAVALVAVAAPWVLMWLVLGMGSLGALLALALSFLLTGGLLAAHWWTWSARWRRVSEGLAQARERDGQVCPMCHQTPATSPDAPRCCRAAPTGWDADAYRAWWQTVRDRGIMDHSLWSAFGDARSRWRTWRPGTMTLLWPALGLFGPLATGSLPVDAWEWLLLLAPRAIFGYGFDLFIRGFGLVRFGPLACAQCSYPLAGSSAPKCPECGSAWRAPGGSVSQRRAPRWSLAATGLVIAVLGGTMWWHLTMGGGAWIRRFQPTASLILVAANNGPSTFIPSDAAWRELARRTLVPAEESTLFDALLDGRSRSSFMSALPRNWVTAFLAAGKASPAQLARWRRGSFVPELTAPAAVRVGEPIPIEIRGEHMEQLLPPAVGVAVHLGTVGFEGDPPSPPKGGPGAWTLEISQRKTIPSAELRSDVPGVREIVVTVWLVARPYGQLSKPVEWNADGTPLLPPDGLWAEPIELRRSITVGP